MTMSFAVASGMCACGGGKEKPQVDVQSVKDSVVKAMHDSIKKVEAEKAMQDSIAAYEKLHSEAAVKERIEQFLSAYKGNGSYKGYLSERAKGFVNRWNKSGYEPWGLLAHTGSEVEILALSGVKVTRVDGDTAKGQFVMKYTSEAEEGGESKPVYVGLILEGGQWVVDELIDDGGNLLK